MFHVSCDISFTRDIATAAGTRLVGCVCETVPGILAFEKSRRHDGLVIDGNTKSCCRGFILNSAILK